MPLSNNSCERICYFYAILRSNYKHKIPFVWGTRACCIWFSLIQTTKENVKEKIYLEYQSINRNEKSA